MTTSRSTSSTARARRSSSRGTGPGPFAASDLATHAGRALLLRQPFAPTELDEVILGCAAPSVDEVNIGRVAALRMGCGQKVPGWTVMRNCASGMQALDSAINNILAGRSNLVLAGGVDALSRAPLLYNDAMVIWLAELVRGEDASAQRAALLAQFRSAHLAPVIGIMKGLTDPIVGLLMGQTAENLAHRFGITRARNGRIRGAQPPARARGAERRPLRAAKSRRCTTRRATLYALDDGVRADSTVENLAKLQALLRPQVRQRHGRQQLADHRRRRVAGPRLRTRGGQAQLEADRAASSTRNGRGSIRRRWASGPCTRRRRSCSATASSSTTSTPGRSTKRSPRRCSAASPRGRTRSTARSSSA